MKNKLWFKIFLQIAAVFAVFVVVLTVANSVLLVRFFEHTEKRLLREQGTELKTLDYTNTAAVIEKLSDLRDRYNFETEIYSESGEVLFTSFSSQMLDFYYKDNHGFKMNHKPLLILEESRQSDGSVFEKAVDNYTDTEFLLCRLPTDSGVIAEVRVQTRLLKNSAQIASEFITIIAFICLAFTLIFIVFSARRITRPITQMGEITRSMADLDFSRRVEVTSADEIGVLGTSINELSGKLNTTLSDLRRTNTQLRDEIELERQLDVMRRGFVANVSHELKTPISIIQGYAEGLKLNINSTAREQYCDTIIDESARMNRLVLGLLQLSRYESGQIPVCPEEFSLTQMAAEMLSRILEGAPLSFSAPVQEQTAFADPTQTEQIFKSILENARAHTPEGGRVDIHFTQNGDDVRVHIHNTGSHIEEDKMPEIWQSFFRGEQSHKRDDTRFGLGLSIVSAICRTHGKKCGVYNTEDGVCFWFDVASKKIDD